MAISGNLYVYTQGGFVYVKAENCGQAATLTHNVFGTEHDAKTLHVHDDHVAAGQQGSGAIDANLNVSRPYSGTAQHGVPVPQGTPTAPGHAGYKLKVGLSYGQYNPNGRVAVGPGQFLRVGFRGIAWGTVQIPPEGQVAVVPYTSLTYQGPRGVGSTANMKGPPVAPSLQGNFINDVAALMMAGKDGVMVNGQMRVVPRAHPERPNELLGWEVWFENAAPPAFKGSKMKTGFTGTIVMTDASGEGTKNAGLGLDSMAVPEGGYSAMQFIRAGANYGVEAKAGAPFRAGIRGYSTYEGALPTLKQGVRTVPLAQFERGADIENSKFFDTKELKSKMGEKKNRIRFFKDGASINDSLPETIYRGMEAFQTADILPPRLQVKWVEDKGKYKGGGWLITMTNPLPQADGNPDACGDELGPLAFTGTLKLVDGDKNGKDFRKLPTHTFEKPGETHEWFLPSQTELAGVVAQPGTTLEVGTRGMGWLSKIPLPAKGQPFDSLPLDNSDKSPWELWETQHERARLYPDYEPLPDL